MGPRGKGGGSAYNCLDKTVLCNHTTQGADNLWIVITSFADHPQLST